MNEYRVPLFGIWGPTRSGKSSYFSALFTELNNDKQNWGISTWGDPKEIKASEEYLGNCINAISKGTFPEPTTNNNKVAMFYEIKHVANNKWNPKERFIKRNRKYHLIVADVPGILVEADDDFDNSDYYDHLSECDGLILMIDPNTLTYASDDSRSYTQTIPVLLNALRQRKGLQANEYINLAVAICITKADTLKYWEVGVDWTSQEVREQYVEDIVGKAIMRQLKLAFDDDKRRYFFTSSVGHYKTPSGLIKSNLVLSKKNEMVAHRPPVSVCVKAPLLWLFDYFDKFNLTTLERIGRYWDDNEYYCY